MKTLPSNPLKATAALLGSFLLLISMLSLPAGAAEDPRWTQLRTSYFGDREITSGDTIITMEAPKRAHDAATVPIVLEVFDTSVKIKQVHLFVDQNPLPLAGIFKFRDEADGWHSFETRIRINEYTNVRAVAELENGDLHMTERFVKAAGGCSAPSMADMDAAMARAGKMKILLDEINDEGLASASAVIKISHPNNSGMQFDQISRNYIPAFFVHTIVAELDGKPLLDIETNFSLSENPVIRLNFSPETTQKNLLVYAVDSKGNRYQKALHEPN
ncbi:quinoprotein dehydrogenase-associated SoxYZ-like carrier [Chromatiales bacterium (ex Bugula neritina AB1)]|nr:quinoprotein dehydrogenase-associated SoxYZ-like carrier [Chromatiales bacterium (ex Bugula neritina AB1)]